MTDEQRRAEKLAAMTAGSVPGVVGSGTTIHGLNIDTMNEAELRIALGWALSQMARLMPHAVGVHGETKQ